MSDLLNSYHDGIQGVLLIDSGEKGSILGISACTHGGEVVGLEVIDYLLKIVDIENKIKKGKIYFILSNIKAYEKNRELEKKGDPDYIINSRYLEENMNRCCSVEDLEDPISYERKRANELTKILEKLECHFDIHSTMNPSGSMFIHTAKSEKEFKDTFNTDEVYIGLPETVIGKPFIDIAMRKGAIGMAIETGNQTNKEGYRVGIDNILRLLLKLDMIDEDMIDTHLLLKTKANEKYDIIGSIMIHSDTFKAVKEFDNLEYVKEGDLIALDDGKEIKVKNNCFIIMPSQKKAGEEYCFLATKISSSTLESL